MFFVFIWAALCQLEKVLTLCVSSRTKNRGTEVSTHPKRSGGGRSRLQVCLPSLFIKRQISVLSLLWPDIVLGGRRKQWTRQKGRQGSCPVELPQGTDRDEPCPEKYRPELQAGRRLARLVARAPPTRRSGLAHSPPARAAPSPPLWRQQRRLGGPQMRGHAGRPAVNHTQAELGAAGAAAAAAAAMGPQREICG